MTKPNNGDIEIDENGDIAEVRSIDFNAIIANDPILSAIVKDRVEEVAQKPFVNFKFTKASQPLIKIVDGEDRFSDDDWRFVEGESVYGMERTDFHEGGPVGSPQHRKNAAVNEYWRRKLWRE